MAKTREQYINEKMDNGAVSFDLVDQHTVERLRRDGKIQVPAKKLDIPKDKRWNEKYIGSQILQGIESGDSIDKISRRILPEIVAKADFDYKSESIPNLITRCQNSAIRNARTMTTSAENNGRLDSYKYLDAKGVVQKKEWMSTPDDRTRPTHVDIDGEEQDIDKAFSNGCMFPGDGKGPAEEVWMCRCTMTDHIIGFRRADGSISKVNYTPDRTLHEEQMEDAKERRGINDQKPATLKHYDETYAEFKAKRESQIEDKTPFEEMDKMLNDLVDNNEFRMRIPIEDPDTLESILRDGEFKTQLETGTTKGAFTPNYRKQASTNLFGTASNIADSEYEKYGYLGSKDLLNDDNTKLDRYGSGIITFNKDNIFDRTTLTIGDSLRDASDGRYVMGTMVNDIDSMVAIGRPNGMNDYLKYAKDGIDKYGIEQASQVGYGIRGDYIELQYHGKLTLADVDTITVDKFILDDITSNPELLKILKDNEIKCNYIAEGKIIPYEL